MNGRTNGKGVALVILFVGAMLCSLGLVMWFSYAAQVRTNTTMASITVEPVIVEPVILEPAVPEPEPVMAPARTRLALVIDDWGYDWDAAEGFLGLGVPITIAVLPFLPQSVIQAQQALRHGHEVILHMPMEPENENLPLGWGAITTLMDDGEIVAGLNRALAALPGASGVSNHQGSRFTTDERAMAAVLRAVKDKGLMFLDSRTSPHSVAVRVAQRLGVPVTENDRFIDNTPTVEAVTAELMHVGRVALKQGHAVAIGHVKSTTLQAVKDAIPRIEDMGIEFVPLSRVVLWQSGRYNRVTPPR